MTKNMYVAIFFLLLLFAGCGFFIVAIQKDEVEKDVEMFLIQNRLQRVVDYEKTALSLSDAFVLKNVRLKSPVFFNFQNKINTLRVRSFRRDGNAATDAEIFADGISFDVLEAFKNFEGSPSAAVNTLTDFSPVADVFFHPTAFFLFAGCNTVKADAALTYAYRPAAQRLFVTVAVKDACLGDTVLSLSFGNITPQKQRALLEAGKKLLSGKDFMPDMKTFLAGSSLVKADAVYTETKLVTGYKRYVDTLYLRLPGHPAPTDLDTCQIQTVASYLSFFSIHKQRNLELARTLAKFVKNPRTLKISTKAGKEIGLDTLKGDIHKRILDLLLRMDVSVAAD